MTNNCTEYFGDMFQNILFNCTGTILNTHTWSHGYKNG